MGETTTQLERALHGKAEALMMQTNEIESLRQQLAECERERDAWHTTADGYAQSLATVTKERDELKTWLEDQVCEAKDFAYKLEGKTVELATVTKERDELVATMHKIALAADTSLTTKRDICVDAKAALAKLGAGKTGEGS